MSELVVIGLLFAAGLAVLVADIFLPSHFVLTVVGLGLLAAGTYRVFVHFGSTAGFCAVVGCVVVWPVLAYIGVKNLHRTPIGRRLIHPNTERTPEDTGIDVVRLKALIGTRGVACTPLRPVGMCEFEQDRVVCLAEVGLIDAGTPVVGIAVRSAQLVVAAV